MKTFFMEILSLSLSGTFVGLIILLIRPLTGKYFSKSWNYYIWLLVLVRLLLPFSIEADFLKLSSASISLEQAETSTDFTTDTNAQTPSENIAGDSIPQTAAAALPASTKTDTPSRFFHNAAFELHIPTKNNTRDTFVTAVAILWLLGAAAALFIRLWDYRKFVNRIKETRATVTDKNIILTADTLADKLHIRKRPVLYDSAVVSVPVTVGLFHPMVVIPKGAQDMTQMSFILQHELIHISRRDLWYKWLYQLLLCVHWFNPILYLVGQRINSDCELSCDEAVLARLTSDDRQTYGNVLLDTAQHSLTYRGIAFSTTLLSSKKDLRKRLDGILSYKKQTRFRLMLSVCTLMAVLMLTACSNVSVSSDSNSPSSASKTTAGRDRSTTDSTAADNEQNIRRNAELVYDDALLLAGEDVQALWNASGYHSTNRHIDSTDFLLNGSNSILIAYAAKDTQIQLESSFSLSSGKFKIVAVAPDGSILTVNDTGEHTTQTVPMKQGRNVIKLVGQQARLGTLEIDFSDMTDSDFNHLYYSEQTEAIYLVVDSILTGESTQKDEFMKVLAHIEPAEVSAVFATLIDRGITFTTDELAKLLFYSDKEQSSKCLMEAIASGKLEAPKSEEIGDLLFYLDDNYKSALLKTLPTEEFYDAFMENNFCLNTEAEKDCLSHYLQNGGSLSYDQFKELSFCLDDTTAQWLYGQLLQGH